MEITNTIPNIIALATTATFAPMESVALVSTFEEDFKRFMENHPDVYVGSITACADKGLCRYVFIVPTNNQEAINDSMEIIQILDVYRETTDSLKNH